MSTPINERSKYAAMYDWAGIQIFNLVRDRFHPDLTEVLDVGAGWGKYHYLLPDYEKMDACEIWKPNCKAIANKYRTVFNIDICDLDFDYYDVIIMGDILEHIERERAKKLIETIYPKCKEMYIVVPFEYEQGAVDGNPYEEHKQADLTPELMYQEYPLLDLLAAGDGKGLYVKR